MAHLYENDYTPGGLRLEGKFENDRNTDAADLLKAIIREVYNVKDVIIGHHLVYAKEEMRDGFSYETVEEIPSIDTLIFDHQVAKILWPDNWQHNLTLLALEPCETRNELLTKLYKERTAPAYRKG